MTKTPNPVLWVVLQIASCPADCPAESQNAVKFMQKMIFGRLHWLWACWQRECNNNTVQSVHNRGCTINGSGWNLRKNVKILSCKMSCEQTVRTPKMVDFRLKTTIRVAPLIQRMPAHAHARSIVVREPGCHSPQVGASFTTKNMIFFLWFFMIFGWILDGFSTFSLLPF